MRRLSRFIPWYTRCLGALAIALFFLIACSNQPYVEEDDNLAVLYTHFESAPKDLDPATAYDTLSHQINGEICATVVEYDYLTRPYRLIPGLAEKVPDLLADDKGFYLAFSLREDLLFADDACFKGKERRVTAFDFAFALERAADPKIGSPIFESLSVISGFRAFSSRLVELRKDAKNEGLSAWELYKKAGGIDGIEIKNELDVVIRLSERAPQMIFWFAVPFTAPIPHEALEYYDGKEGRPTFSEHPVGAGPFRIGIYDKQSRITLIRNENYHGLRHPEWKAPGSFFPEFGKDDPGFEPDTAGKALPLLDHIELRREKESIPSFSKFLQGYYDLSGVSRDSFDSVMRGSELSPDLKSAGVRLLTGVSSDIYYIGFNMDDPILGAASAERGKKLRQALSLALNVPEYLKVFMNGRGVHAQSPFPPGLAGYDPRYRNPYGAFNLAKAKQLLVDAGYPGGIDPKTSKALTLHFDTSDTSPDGALRYRFFSDSWKKIGVNVVVDATSFNRFQEKLREGAFQIYLSGWLADYPDPENFGFLLQSDMSRTKNGGPNSSNFSNAEYDKLYLEMKVESDLNKREALLREMRDLLNDEMPWIPLFHSERYGLYHSWLKGVKPPSVSIPTMKYWSIDAASRKGLRSSWNRPVLWPIPVFGILLLAFFYPLYRSYRRALR